MRRKEDTSLHLGNLYEERGEQTRREYVDRNMHGVLAWVAEFARVIICEKSLVVVIFLSFMYQKIVQLYVSAVVT